MEHLVEHSIEIIQKFEILLLKIRLENRSLDDNPTESQRFEIICEVSWIQESGPPEITLQNDTEVWYRTSEVSNEQNAFSLYCQASGDPEKYEWYKDGKPLLIDGQRIVWEKPSLTGNIKFLDPKDSDQGYYQCYASNNIGTAVSNKIQLSLGFLDLYVDKDDETYTVPEGDKLSLPCRAPFGKPRPQIIWIYRKKSDPKFIKSINDPRITIDDDAGLKHLKLFGPLKNKFFFGQNFSRLKESYVLAKDAAPDLLYQCGAYSPVLQDGHRFGNYINISLSSDQSILNAKPSVMYVSPENVSIRVGAELKLTCIFGG
uniref:Ig-like domain-containing protein n=1 Tax=Syphacia muris TaxID=451379 RepID=A0A0N5A7T7_9BILA